MTMQAHTFLWTTKFQSEQVNPKSYLLSLATKICLQYWYRKSCFHPYNINTEHLKKL